jgi:hypothetical protein
VDDVGKGACLFFSSEIVVGGEEKHAMALLPAQADHTVEEQMILTELLLYIPITNYIPQVFNTSG